MDFITVVISEMAKGNFSFLILVVGIIQVILMWRNGRNGRSNNEI